MSHQASAGRIRHGGLRLHRRQDPHRRNRHATAVPLPPHSPRDRSRRSHPADGTGYCPPKPIRRGPCRFLPDWFDLSPSRSMQPIPPMPLLFSSCSFHPVVSCLVSDPRNGAGHPGSRLNPLYVHDLLLMSCIVLVTFVRHLNGSCPIYPARPGFVTSSGIFKSDSVASHG